MAGPMTPKARELMHAIRSNVDDWYEDRIDRETFHQRQVALWDEARAFGVDREVARNICRG